MNDEYKTVGKSIITASVAGLILLFLVQVFAIMNLKISGSGITSTSLFVVSLIVVFLVGMLAEALVSKTKKPLIFGLATSTFSTLTIVAINMLVGYVTISTMQANVPIILRTMLSSIPMNIMTFVSMLFVSGLGVKFYWWMFNKTKELNKIKKTCEETKDWKKYIVTLVLVLAVMGISYMIAAHKGIDFIGAIVILYIMSWLITWLGRGVDWAKSFHVFGANIVFGVLVGLAVIIPVLVGSASKSLLALGISVVISFILGFFTILWMIGYPFVSANDGMISGFKKISKAFKKKLIDLTGELTLLYLVVFCVQIIQGILAYLGWMVNIWVALAIEALISAWILEFSILQMYKIVKELA